MDALEWNFEAAFRVTDFGQHVECSGNFFEKGRIEQFCFIYFDQIRDSSWDRHRDMQSCIWVVNSMKVNFKSLNAKNVEFEVELNPAKPSLNLDLATRHLKISLQTLFTCLIIFIYLARQGMPILIVIFIHGG